MVKVDGDVLQTQSGIVASKYLIHNLMGNGDYVVSLRGEADGVLGVRTFTRFTIGKSTIQTRSLYGSVDHQKLPMNMQIDGFSFKLFNLCLLSPW